MELCPLNTGWMPVHFVCFIFFLRSPPPPPWLTLGIVPIPPCWHMSKNLILSSSYHRLLWQRIITIVIIIITITLCSSTFLLPGGQNMLLLTQVPNLTHLQFFFKCTRTSYTKGTNEQIYTHRYVSSFGAVVGHCLDMATMWTHGKLFLCLCTLHK